MDSPIDEPAKSDGPEPRPLQYSLRSLLELSVVACIGLSLWRWGGEALSRAPEFYLGLAAAIIVFGLIMRRKTWILGGAVIAVALFCGLRSRQVGMDFESRHNWNKRQFVFKVVEQSSMATIRGAIVEVTSGKPSARKSSRTETGIDGTVTTDAMWRSDFGLVITDDRAREIEINVCASGYETIRRTLLDNEVWSEIIVIELQKKQ